MNAFLTQNRESFKSFIDDMCYVPTTLSTSAVQNPTASPPTYASGVVSTETHLSYTTPMTIMQRLPPTSREGFPSLPYLIDSARASAELVQLWLEATTAMTTASESAGPTRSHAEVMAAIRASEGDLLSFHQICTGLHARTQECLNRAERAERPTSAISFQWEELLDQLQTNKDSELVDDLATQSNLDSIAGNAVSERSDITSAPRPSMAREWDTSQDDDTDDDNMKTMLYDTTPSQTTSHSALASTKSRDSERPGSSGKIHGLRDSLRRAQLQSRGSDSAAASASASVSNVSSTMSSDTEQTGPTALPSYEKELRHRERREAAKKQIKHELEASRLREKEKEKRKGRPPIVSALRRRREERESRSDTGGSVEGYTSHG